MKYLPSLLRFRSLTVLGIQKNGQSHTDLHPDANLTFTIVKGGNHGSVECYFREDKIYNWMLSQVKFIP